MRLTTLAAAAALLASAFHPAASQMVGTAPSRGPGWLPRESHISRGDPYTRTEEVEVLARLEAIEKIVLKVDDLIHPVGFEIEPNFYAGGAAYDGEGPAGVRGQVIGYSYALGMYAPTRKIAGEGTNCLSIHVNGSTGAGQSPYSNSAGKMYVESDHGDPMPGAYVWDRLSRTERSVVNILLTSGGAPIWKTVTRGDFLDAVLVYNQGDPHKMAEAQKAVSETPYQRWMAGAAERKQMRDMIVAALEPAEGAARRKKMEDDERVTTEQLKAGEAKYKAGIGNELSLQAKMVDMVRAKIAATSPAERRIPAWLDRRAGQDAFPLVAPNSEPAVRVLQFDNDFFRARRSRVEARSIHVHISASLTCNRPVVQRVMYAVFQKLDYAALARLLEPRE
jgi:hypothetical protein